MARRQYVSPGDPLNIAAAQINFLNGLMAADTSYAADSMDGWRFGGNIIRAQNMTGAAVERWGVMAVTGIVIDPNGGDKQRREFEGMPCVVGEAITSGASTKAVVAIEPIASNAIGRVASAGVVQIKLADVDKLAGSSVLWEGGEWALVRINGGGGRLKVCSFFGAWPKNTTKAVTMFVAEDITSSTPPNATERETMTVRNILFDIDVPCDGSARKGIIAQIDGVWVLVNFEC